MTQKRYDKLAKGDLAYRYPNGGYHNEGRMGIVIEIEEAGGQDPPHIFVETLIPGKKISYDYRKIGSLGSPRPATGIASVKLLFDPEIFVASGRLSGKPPEEDEHRRWKILEVAGRIGESGDNRWALVEDSDWPKRQHWLPKNVPYRFSVVDGGMYHEVCLEGIPLDL